MGDSTNYLDADNSILESKLRFVKVSVICEEKKHENYCIL